MPIQRSLIFTPLYNFFCSNSRYFVFTRFINTNIGICTFHSIFISALFVWDYHQIPQYLLPRMFLCRGPIQPDKTSFSFVLFYDFIYSLRERQSRRSSFSDLPPDPLSVPRKAPSLPDRSQDVSASDHPVAAVQIRSWNCFPSDR